MSKVLFVCLGNICRSPTAHAVFQALVDRNDLSERFVIDSAGTAAWHIGKAPDERSQQCAAKRSYDMSLLQARQVAESDYEEFDLLLAMDQANFDSLKAACPAKYLNKIQLFLDYSACSESEVPDPYYGGEAGFDHVLNLVESASEGLLVSLMPELSREYVSCSTPCVSQ